MSEISHRERVLLALNHIEPDRVPIDFGGANFAAMTLPAYQKLEKHLGMEYPSILRGIRAQTVVPAEAVLEYFDIDTRPLLLGDFTDGFKEIAVNTLVDGWGTTWKKAPDGHYITVDGPFKDSESPNFEILEKHPWPDPDDPGPYKGLKERAEYLRKYTDYALILALPLGVIHQSQFLRGFTEWLMDFYRFPDFAVRLMDIASDIWIRIAENAINAVGENVDVIAWGDDLGMQEGPLMNPEIYRKYIKPYHQKMIRALKSRSEAKVLFHSCGSVFPFIEDLIENGVDALNPLQVSAKDMDPAVLKEQFGERISFWGGIDTHHVLPKESPKKVREEVEHMVKLLGKGGGYVLASVHNIQNDVPAENAVAMFEAARTAKWN